MTKKYKRADLVHVYTELTDLYGKQISLNSCYDIAFYRITGTECNDIVQFLNRGLEIICTVQTIPEGEGFERL